MRRIILAALAALICVSAAAQLNVKKSRSATETIVILRAGSVKVCATENFIYFVLPSSNQFDDPFLFMLGKTAESAIETLDDLVQLVTEGEVGSSVDVEQGSKTVTILVDRQLGVRVLYFSAPGVAGSVSTSKGELERMKSALLKWKK